MIVFPVIIAAGLKFRTGHALVIVALFDSNLKLLSKRVITEARDGQL